MQNSHKVGPDNYLYGQDSHQDVHKIARTVKIVARMVQIVTRMVRGLIRIVSRVTRMVKTLPGWSEWPMVSGLSL